MIVVSDTSVITSLLQIGYLELLRKLHQRVLIPDAVHFELKRSHPTLPDYLEICAVHDNSMVARLETELDLGEAEAIVLAKERNADLLLIDEKIGRQVALREGIRIAGLVALLIEAKRRKFILSVRELVMLLETKAGFRLSDAVKTEAFRAANE